MCNKDLGKEICELKAMVKAQNKRIDMLIKHVKEGCAADEDKEKESTIQNLNPYLPCLCPDVLFHLNLDTATTDFPKVFGDVRFVCLGGTAHRMEAFAYFIMREIGLKLSTSAKLKDLSEDGHRYALFKVGPVLCASHGIGCPSISILLHELIKLVHHAKCQNPIFIRLGTCGGIGVEPGTVVITSEAIDGQLRAAHEVVVHGQAQLRPTQLDAELAEELKSLCKPGKDGFVAVVGKTLCANDFYEGQSRLDGAFCDYTPAKRLEFLQRLSELGVTNIEMESTAFAALTAQANIKSAVICVAILNRLEGDQITTPLDTLHQWDMRPQMLVARYMRRVLYGDPPEETYECWCSLSKHDVPDEVRATTQECS